MNLLEKIVGYLPYKLNYHQALPNNEHWILEMYISTIGLVIEHENRKPILHPLSDLTKEIEIDGRKFVPIDELSEWLYNEEPESFDNIESSKAWINATINLEGGDFENLPYKIIVKLFSWHFDIHGLIDEGLAIDINTLNK